MLKTLNLQRKNELSNSRILASKRWGNNVVFLSETAEGFVLSAGEINGVNLRIIAKRVLTLLEAKQALVTIFAVSENIAEEKSESTILLEIPKEDSEAPSILKKITGFVSPYFSKDLSFFVTQPTRAPSLV